jgi:quercetin dioxygenase-like cupin family protein
VGLVRRRGDDWTWEGAEPRSYAGGAQRHTLIGPSDGAGQVELRYFRIPAGQASARESHGHEHAVLILHGRAAVLLGGEVHDAGPGDAVFVASGEEHQFRAVGDEDLGFMCTAPVGRRRPPSA